MRSFASLRCLRRLRFLRDFVNLRRLRFFREGNDDGSRASRREGGRRKIGEDNRRRREFNRSDGAARGTFFVVPTRPRAAFVAFVRHFSVMI